MSIKQELDKYTQEYLNAKANNELPLRIFFNQPTNKSNNLKMGKGRFGAGVYTSGQVVDRNIEDTPSKYQHSTAAELVLDAEDFQSRFEGNMVAADEAGYVGVKYEDDKDGKASYFLFPDTVPLKESGGSSIDNTAIFVHPITGKESKLIKEGSRWSVEGMNKTFRTKQKAIDELQSDIAFLNQTGDNQNG